MTVPFVTCLILLMAYTSNPTQQRLQVERDTELLHSFLTITAITVFAQKSPPPTALASEPKSLILSIELRKPPGTSMPIWVNRITKKSTNLAKNSAFQGNSTIRIPCEETEKKSSQKNILHGFNHQFLQPKASIHQLQAVEHPSERFWHWYYKHPTSPLVV